MPSAAKEKKTGKAKSKPAKGLKAKTAAKKDGAAAAQTAVVLSSTVVFEGRLFRVVRDRLIEPGGHENERDVVRHNGSAVILAVDNSKSKKDPWIVMERQYRHAARQFLWELPAGKIEPGEDPMAGAERELAEETGYRARKWRQMIEFYPSPGFVGESMTVYLAEGLTAGDSAPEEDEKIELRLVKLSEVLKMIGKGAIRDGKTLCGVLWYARFNKGMGKRKRKS